MLEEQPELARGEKVSGDEEQAFTPPDVSADATGFAVPIAYSRYVMNENSIITEVDARFEEITGYSPEEAIGKLKQIELIPPEDRAFYLMQVVNQFSSGDMAYLRHSVLRKDGQRVQVACYGKRYFDSAIRTFKSEIIIFQL